MWRWLRREREEIIEKKVEVEERTDDKQILEERQAELRRRVLELETQVAGRVERMRRKDAT